MGAACGIVKGLGLLMSPEPSEQNSQGHPGSPRGGKRSERGGWGMTLMMVLFWWRFSQDTTSLLPRLCTARTQPPSPAVDTPRSHPFERELYPSASPHFPAEVGGPLLQSPPGVALQGAGLSGSPTEMDRARPLAFWMGKLRPGEDGQVGGAARRLQKHGHLSPPHHSCV